MKRKELIALSYAVFAAAILTGTAAAADEALPKAETIMDRYIEVTGGKAAYEKRKTEIVTMNMELVGKGITGTVTHWADVSNNTFESADLQGIGRADGGVYNGVVWDNSAMMGPRLKTGIEKAEAIRDATFNAPLYWRKLYSKVETAGVEPVGGEDCYKVVATPAEGKPETIYFSKKTGLIVKQTGARTTAMGEILADTMLEDYKAFGGVLQPMKRTQSMMGQQILLTVVDVKTNAEIPKDRFEPPAEVKALIDKPVAAPAAK